MTIKVTPVLAKNALTVAIKAGLVIMLGGHPGIGKSEIIREIATDFSLQMIDLRLAQCEPPDVNGYPNIDQVRKRAEYVPFDTFPMEGDPLPLGKQGWLLFLDEFNSADRPVQKAAYKLVLDKMVGQRKLHPNVVIVCAGNLVNSHALVEEMSSALESRFIRIEMQVDAMEWLDWASSKQIDHRIISYIKHQPKMLYSFDPENHNADTKTYACPRTWVMAHKLLQHMDINDAVCLPLLSGAISEGVAREFIAYLNIYQHQPTIDQIIANPTTVQVPDAPGGQFMMTGTIAAHANATNITSLMSYLDRFPIEFQIISLKEMGKRNPTLWSTKPIKSWLATNNTDLC